MATLTDAFNLIDTLHGDTDAERALLDFKRAMTELANTDRLRGAFITVRFGKGGKLTELDVETRLDMPLRRVVAK